MVNQKRRTPSSRPAAINSIIQRSLAAAQIPSTLEPTGLIGSDGQRPDGVTIAPWKSGWPLVWDATCADTYAASYVVQSIREARAVAELAEIKKKNKYLTIARTHHFVPVVVEISGAFGLDALQLSPSCHPRGKVPCLPVPTCLSGTTAGKCSCGSGDLTDGHF